MSNRRREDYDVGELSIRFSGGQGLSIGYERLIIKLIIDNIYNIYSFFFFLAIGYNSRRGC